MPPHQALGNLLILDRTHGLAVATWRFSVFFWKLIEKVSALAKVLLPLISCLGKRRNTMLIHVALAHPWNL